MSRSNGIQAEINVPIDVILEKLSYDENSGILSWKGNSRNSGIYAGVPVQEISLQEAVEYLEGE